MSLSAERLRDLLSYDPETGLFAWKKPTSNRVRVGDVPKCLDTNGYVVIRIDGRLHRAHRLAFLYMLGRFPAHDSDHANGVRHDNAWTNLREATRQDNLRNKVAKGICLLPNGKWRARITISRQELHLGCFDRIEDAKAAYAHAAQKHFGAFARATQ